jgi:hypothetical protein
MSCPPHPTANDAPCGLDGRTLLRPAGPKGSERRGLPNPEGGRPGWTKEQLALLGTLPDAEVARRTGRTEGAVTHQRNQLGIPTADDRRRLNGRRRG